jgi:subtilisin family serine protease
MGTVTGERASLSGGLRHIGDDVADIMAAFSSRGPNGAVSLVSPSVSAPGVDILAAAGTDNSVEWHFISGTSMASPHTAGALALLKGMQLDVPAAAQWTPAEAQSALMTTAERDITDSDGTAADWFDMGSGRIELRRAAKAGLVLDETLAGYQGANPAVGGDVRALNTASMADDECLQTCAWTRTFTGTSTGVGTWSVSVENLSPGLTLSTDKTSVAVTDGGDVDVTVTAQLGPDVATDTWLFGTLVLTPPSG